MTSFSKRIEPVSIEFKNPRTPYSPLFQDIYFSSTEGIEESTYVYLEGSGFADALARSQSSQRFTVGEIGFGVGLNFLLTYRHFLANARHGETLTYLSAERHPVSAEDLKKLYDAFPELKKESDELLSRYPILTPGFHSLTFSSGRVKLILMFGDAEELFSQVSVSPEHGVRFWYLDGFAPNKNPEAFQTSLIAALARISAPGAQAASFTAAGWVRRGFEGAGFHVEKRPGFGIKRECIRIRFPKHGKELLKKADLPWFSAEKLKTLQAGDAVAVVGAGLSGTAIARALAERGFEVTLLDQEGIAAQTSGNSVGLFNVQLSRLPNPISRFAQLSLTHLIRELKSLSLTVRKGILRLYASERKVYEDALRTSEYPSSFFQLREDGIFFPDCGILNPRKLCGERACHPLINNVVARVGKVEKAGTGFRLVDTSGKQITECNHVVYATGSAQVLDRFLTHPLVAELPLRPIRGQVIHVKPTPESQKLSHALVDSGYITPVAPEVSGTDTHCIGATYQARTVAADQERIDSLMLLQEARVRHPAFASLSHADIASFRVGHRLSTPDKLPMIGPICDPEKLKLEYFRVLRGGADADVRLHALPAEPGEWVFLGVGSRGITYSSYGAEILAALMCGDVLPVEKDLWQHLHSARFIVRNLKKPG